MDRQLMNLLDQARRLETEVERYEGFCEDYQSKENFFYLDQARNKLNAFYSIHPELKLDQKIVVELIDNSFDDGSLGNVYADDTEVYLEIRNNTVYYADYTEVSPQEGLEIIKESDYLNERKPLGGGFIEALMNINPARQAA